MEASEEDGRAAELRDLLGRRERLAGEVAELHWDLGGLAYEMAIRDHIRPDVLVRRAALLQERDAELAEVERKLATLAAAPADGAPGDGPQANQLPVLAPEASPRRRFPSAGIWCLLALACVGFGAALGGATSGPAATGRLAAARPPLRLVLPARGETGGAKAPALPEASATPSPSEPEAAGEEGGSSGAASGGTGTGGGATGKHGSSSTGSSGAGGGAGVGGGGGEQSESSAGGSGGQGSGKKAKLPPVKHVFLIVLDDEPYATSFGPSSPARYLTHTLERKGELLVRYYAVAHEQLANGIALISGQGPTAQTAANCPTYSAIAPASAGADGQVLGSGCVYPTSTPTLPGQLTAKHLTWRAYVEGMDEGGGSSGCGHPALGSEDASSFDPGVGSAAPGAAPAPAGGATRAAPSTGAGPYATFRNPFVYFQSIAAGPACARNDVGLDRLKPDLADATRTPSLSYIVPGLCDDGSPVPCAPGHAAGMTAADGFLKRVVPEILASKAYKHGGLLAITVDEAPSGGEYADSSSCCEQPGFPNLPAPTGTAAELSPAGGGEVGALLLSPFVKAGTTSQEAFNHYSLLRTIENLFGLGHLGYAALPKVEALGASVFNAGG